MVTCAVSILHYFCFLFASGNSAYSFTVMLTFDKPHCEKKLAISRRDSSPVVILQGLKPAPMVLPQNLPHLRNYRSILGRIPQYSCSYRCITITPVPMQPKFRNFYVSPIQHY